jgi:hypothetical protein
MAGSGLVETVVVGETAGELVQAARSTAMTTSTKARDLTVAILTRSRGSALFAEGMDVLLRAADERRVDGDSPTDAHGRGR